MAKTCSMTPLDFIAGVLERIFNHSDIGSLGALLFVGQQLRNQSLVVDGGIFRHFGNAPGDVGGDDGDVH